VYATFGVNPLERAAHAEPDPHDARGLEPAPKEQLGYRAIAVIVNNTARLGVAVRIRAPIPYGQGWR
jgi:hypothetical protein